MSLSGAINQQELREAQQRQQDCLNAAMFAGFKASATALLVSGGMSAALLKYSEMFRSHFTVGAKTSFIMLPVFYSFWWASERSITRCSQDGSKQRFRQRFGVNSPGSMQDTAAPTPPTAATEQ